MWVKEVPMKQFCPSSLHWMMYILTWQIHSPACAHLSPELSPKEWGTMGRRDGMWVPNAAGALFCLCRAELCSPCDLSPHHSWVSWQKEGSRHTHRCWDHCEDGTRAVGTGNSQYSSAATKPMPFLWTSERTWKSHLWRQYGKTDCQLST